MRINTNKWNKIRYTLYTPGRDFESIINKTRLTVVTDNDADFNGNFRLIKLTKN